MNNGKFDVGTVIKGKDLKGEIFCKVLTENMDMRGFQYKIGINEDVKPLATEGSCKAGLHFCLLKNVCRYLCCNAALYSRRKKHIIFDSINIITAHSFR